MPAHNSPAAAPPVARLNKAAPQLNAVCQHVLHFVVVVEQAIAVQPLNAALFDLHGRRHKAIRPDDLQILLIPQDQVQIIIVVAVGVPTFAAPFLHRAKGNLAQAAQLAQQRASS